MLRFHHTRLSRHSLPGLMQCSLIKPSNKHIQAEGNITALGLEVRGVLWGFEGLRLSFHLHHTIPT